MDQETDEVGVVRVLLCSTKRGDAGARSVALSPRHGPGQHRPYPDRALVAFYPLAGRLCLGSDGSPRIDCNAEAALFVVAWSELIIDALRDLKPSPALRRLFVPHIEPVIHHARHTEGGCT
ncbi:hypothetical protein E2562_018627 [Oryza meyeriana var. granulata]|uniref:Uncharacterized protein n=1 Tax=Oryza meyeriana var. granulata TaxID=110450 RepID=A0A6G1BYV6_9ORYZ|nr:hypothetical protein E2562_018627 [Oryza meyeriana var. granulata]